MIEIDKVTKKFRTNFWEKELCALDDVSFNIEDGDLVGFLGANGAGKTTLIKCLMDFSKPTSGSISFSQSLGSDPIKAKYKIGYLPEKTYLYPHLTGREFLEYSGSLYSLSRDTLTNKILYWSEKLNMIYALDRQIKTYSKGMQQRISFISSLLNDPTFLILDEPLSGLDPVGRRDFKNIFRELNQNGTTIIFSSHVVSDVEELCNKVVFIEKGKLVYDGSLMELVKTHSTNDYEIVLEKNNEIFHINIDKEKKDSLILEKIKLNYSIMRVEKNHISLEEIIYKIKK